MEQETKGVKVNTIRATGVTGIYKGKRIEIKIDPEGEVHGVKVDGQSVADMTTEVCITLKVGEPVEIVMTFVDAI